MVLDILVQTARAIGGLLLTLFIPGAAFILAMYPKRDDLELVERIALSSVMSIAITLLTPLFLDLVLGIDFTAVNVTIALLVFTGLCLVAWFIQTRGRFQK